MTDIEVDLATGLPALPDGYRWYILDSFWHGFMIRLEQQSIRRRERWSKVLDRKISTNQIGRSDSGPQYTPQNREIIASAAELLREWRQMESLRTSLDRDAERRQVIVGPYPPKSL